MQIKPFNNLQDDCAKKTHTFAARRFCFCTATEQLLATKQCAKDFTIIFADATSIVSLVKCIDISFHFKRNIL